MYGENRVDRVSVRVKQLSILTYLAFRYDGLGRLIESVDALGGKSQQEFDAGGMPTKWVDPNGHETHWEFDQQGRFIREQVGEGAAVKYSYDAQDLLKQVRNGRG